MTRLERNFWAFHSANPHIYRRLVRMARDLKARGHTKCGVKMFWEVLRWREMRVSTFGPWKLNNNHPSRYAREIMRNEKDLEGFFDTRGLKS